MRKLFFVAVFFGSTFMVKAQKHINHGIGLSVGFNSENKKSLTPEYELSFLNSNKGYIQGFVTGVQVSLPISKEYSDERIRAYSANLGYRLSNLSFGINAGTKGEFFTKKNGSRKEEYSFMTGAWAGLNVSKSVKIKVGGDNFNGFIAGLVLYPNTIKSNR